MQVVDENPYAGRLRAHERDVRRCPRRDAVELVKAHHYSRSAVAVGDPGAPGAR